MEKENVEVMPPQKTWFFTDSSGRVFPTNEKEAFNLLTENSRWRRQDIKMIGMSDGTTYHQVIKSAGTRTKELVELIREKKETLNKYVQGHDKLLFEQFVSEDDARIIRAKELIKKVEDELEPLEKELKDLRANIVQKAFDAELEKARGNIVMPRDFTVVTKNDAGPMGNRILENFANAKRVL